MNVTCEIMPQSWAKRRDQTDHIVQPVSVKLNDFKYEDNTYCTMDVVFDDDSTMEIKGRISFSCSYDHDLKPFNGRWTVQGYNAYGVNVVVKVIE